MFASLAQSLLDASIGPMQKPAAALVRPFTTINKVTGTCDDLQVHNDDSRIGKERQENRTKDCQGSSEIRKVFNQR
jgi:hypothetical protein